jgi:asparagine synthase (glutamine-hydrolysing)
MCGIAGFAGPGSPEILEAMARSLARRGPDDNGVYHDGRVGLASTRLAVIDLSALGHQPMASAAGDLVIAYNGEIYNFRELRAELERAGHGGFRGHSDTEVLLRCYEVYGEKAFAKLRGMFAFALYDRRSGRLFLVRDHLGKKPLYWANFAGTLIFGSEIKALMCHPAWQGRLNREAIGSYLVYEAVPTDLAIFEGVHKVPPATYLVFEGDTLCRTVSFWHPAPPSGERIDFAAAGKLLDAALSRSVKQRLVADVPVGVFLSGGLDSSAIAYYASLSGKVKTFSIGFEEESFDESRQAEEVSRFLGTTHTSEIFSAEKCVDVLAQAADYMDEPNADPSLLPTFLLSAFTRRSVTVALGGDGADELFAGYPTFRAEAYFRTYAHVPAALRRSLIEPLIRRLPVSHDYMSLDFRLKKFLDGTEAPERYRHQHWIGAFRDDERQAVLSPDFREASSPYSLIDRYWQEAGGDFHRRLLFTYLRTYLMDQVMAKLDRASMANSLEARSPFLDVDLVDLVMGFPYDFKYRRLSGKRILRHLMQGRLPASVTARRKKGFGVPIGSWLRKQMRPLCEDTLSSVKIKASGIFDHANVEKLKQEHFSGQADHRKKLWTLLVFMLWHDRWSAARPQPEQGWNLAAPRSERRA